MLHGPATIVAIWPFHKSGTPIYTQKCHSPHFSDTQKVPLILGNRKIPKPCHIAVLSPTGGPSPSAFDASEGAIAAFPSSDFRASGARYGVVLV